MPGSNGDILKSWADNAYLRLLSYVSSTIAAPAIIYLLATSNHQGQDIVRLEARMEAVTDQLGLKTADRYTSDDARRDQAAIDLRFREVDRRLGRLEAGK